MSYVRRLVQQPARLELLAGQAWTQAVLALLSRHKHSFSDHACLRVLRARLGRASTERLPRAVREDLFQAGCSTVRREVWSALRDFLTPHIWIPFMYVFYSPDIRHLEVPPLIRVTDRLTVLDLLYNLGCPHGHQATNLKLKLFETQNISIEESYVLKRVLRGFRSLRSLILWRVCDDAMLQILGVTCHHLESIDIWKSTNATDAGVRMFLGLDAERPFRVCSSLRKVAIKDTSVTDLGAFSLMIHCDNLEILEFSQDSFLQQLLWRIQQNFLQTETVFNLKNLFLQVNKPGMLVAVVRSLPGLEDLTVWSSLVRVEGLVAEHLSNLSSLKLAGLDHAQFLTDMAGLVGHRLTKLCIETVQFDVDISLVGRACPALQQLSIVNARLVAGLSTGKWAGQAEEREMFSKLTQLYLFLVQYLTSPCTQSALTAILHAAPNLTSVQATGSTDLADNIIIPLAEAGRLSRLGRLVITQPHSLEQGAVRLGAAAVTALARHCPDLTTLGDLKHWHIPPHTRRKLIKKLGTSKLGL